jgi:predicted RNA-binding protein
MTNYWIFVSVPYSDFNVGTVSEMIEKIRSTGKWLIGRRTIHRKQLSKGDKVIFYQAGEGAKKFVGSAELLSYVQSDETSIFDYVTLRDVKLWKKYVSIKELLSNLSFVGNKKHWGLYLQGGIISISEEDYNLILKARRRI